MDKSRSFENRGIVPYDGVFCVMIASRAAYQPSTAGEQLV